APCGGPAGAKRGPLPQRWLRGFAEVQVIPGAFEPRAELSATEAARFLRSLPKGSRAGGAQWAVPAGRSLRLTPRAAAGAVCLPPPPRPEALAPLLPYAPAPRADRPGGRARGPACP